MGFLLAKLVDNERTVRLDLVYELLSTSTVAADDMLHLVRRLHFITIAREDALEGGGGWHRREDDVENDCGGRERRRARDYC